MEEGGGREKDEEKVEGEEGGEVEEDLAPFIACHLHVLLFLCAKDTQIVLTIYKPVYSIC